MPIAELAQSVERKALNLVVVGSSPTFGVFALPAAPLSVSAWSSGMIPALGAGGLGFDSRSGPSLAVLFVSVWSSGMIPA